MKLILISPSNLPIPVTKGGAVETGIQQIIDENEIQHKVDILVYSYYEDEAKELSKKYKYSKFIFYKENKLKKFIRYNIKCLNYILKKLKLKFSFNIHYNYLNFIIKDMKKYEKSIVLVKNAVNFVIPIKKHTNNKVFLQLHNDFLNCNTYNSEAIAESCDKLIANSEYIKKCILSVSNVNENKVLINKNCLDDNDFDEILDKQLKEKAIEYNIDRSKKNILFSGRIVRQKGIKELLYAVNELPKEVDWKLNIIGSKSFGKTKRDKFFKELYSISKKNENRINFVGYVKHSDVKFLNKLSDVVVIPSIWEEPAGRVALEAQVVGTPIIITNSGGLIEYTNDKSSIVVNKEENLVSNLAKAINLVLSDDVVRKNMGKEAKKFAMPYTAKHYYTEILEALDII